MGASMSTKAICTLGLASMAMTNGEVYLQEQFNDGNAWESRWVQSGSRPAHERGAFKAVRGKFHGGAENDLGLQTSEDARFYQYTAKLDKELNNSGKDLVVQFTVKHEQNLDCGGAYIKLLPKDTDQSKFNGDSAYAIMFGPDICGGATKKTHAILSYEKDGKLENLQNKKHARAETDNLSHLYTMVLSKDNTYEVKIDGEVVTKGTLEGDFDFLPPAKINDPAVSKPSDWVDEKQIPDPADVKPEGYDDISPTIPDAEAVKPDDWDDEDDGEWEAPTVPNPAYNGPWSPRMIANPAYKGEWTHPQIDNPSYDASKLSGLHARCTDCAYVGFELWQVKSGTVFDDLFVSDSVSEAEAFAKSTFFAKQAGEKKMHDDEKAEREAAEAKAREEEAARRKAEEEANGEEEEEEAEGHDEL